MEAEQKRREAEIAVEHAQKRLRDLEADMAKMTEHYAKQVIITTVPPLHIHNFQAELQCWVKNNGLFPCVNYILHQMRPISSAQIFTLFLKIKLS